MSQIRTELDQIDAYLQQEKLDKKLIDALKKDHNLPVAEQAKLMRHLLKKRTDLLKRNTI